MTSVPRPNANFSGVVEVEVLGYDVERTLSVRWTDADPASAVHWTSHGRWNKKAAVRVCSFCTRDSIRTIRRR